MWGAIEDVGMLERDNTTKAHLRSIGCNAMSARQGLEMLLATAMTGCEVIARIGWFCLVGRAANIGPTPQCQD